jgi:hypothetical protein
MVATSDRGFLKQPKDYKPWLNWKSIT